MTVQRFTPEASSGESMWLCASMEPVSDGEWVRYSDYIALERRIAEAPLVVFSDFIHEGMAYVRSPDDELSEAMEGRRVRLVWELP